MLSVIIASVNPKMLEDVKNNIAQTIGVPFEVLAYENSDGRRSICEIYNQGVADANYKYICFTHEDVGFKTYGWGKTVVNLFNENSRVGLVGVAGSSYKCKAPSGWGVQSEQKKYIYVNYIQGFKNKNHPAEHILNNPGGNSLQKVICIDGFWMCTMKEIAQKNPFDEELLKGFHCYDIDISLQIGQYYDVAVTFDVLISHFSEGSYNKGWLNDTIAVHDKWRRNLPQSAEKVNDAEAARLEKRALKTLLKTFVKHKQPLFKMLSFLTTYWLKKEITVWEYIKLSYYACKYYAQNETAN